MASLRELALSLLLRHRWQFFDGLPRNTILPMSEFELVTRAVRPSLSRARYCSKTVIWSTIVIITE